MEKTFTNKFGQKQSFNANTFGDGIKSVLHCEDRDYDTLIEQITSASSSVAVFTEGLIGDKAEVIDKVMQRAFYSNRDNFSESKVGNKIKYYVEDLPTAEDLACRYVDNYLALLYCSGAICDVLSREHYLPEENGGLVATDLEERPGARHMTIVTLEDKRGENVHRFAILLEDFDKGLEMNQSMVRSDPCTKVKVETYFYCNRTNNFELDDSRWLCDINGDYLKRIIKVY